MKQLLNPTRGKIISSLRGGERTVNELVAEVRLTDNAVRSHLEALVRQGLVFQSGLRAGSRKPHYLYKLTSKAEQIFFEACEPLLTQLLGTLASRFSQREFKDLLREAGRRLAIEQAVPIKGATKKQRIDHALALLKELGGKAALEKKNGTLVIQSASCPWSILVAKHSEVCVAAESLLSELIGIPVRQHCFLGESPRCSFHLSGTAS